MELWVRSQDKEDLVKVSGVRINCYNEKEIKGYFNYGDDIIIGRYITKKRALEVLDEIQKLLIPQTRLISNKDLEGNDIKVYGVEYINSYVYEMPKE